MKIFYLLTATFLLVVACFQLNAKCTATLQIGDDGKGGYTFQAIVSDTDSVFTSYWLVDSVVIDSNTLIGSYKFYSNGNHRVCFQYTDTTGCSIDTCVTISVQDAEYYPLLDSVNIWSMQYNSCFVIVLPSPPAANPPSRDLCNMGTTFYHTVYANDDTLINNLNYKAVYLENYCVPGFLREDTVNRKIYYISVTDSTEVLLYNFSLKIGDTINLAFKDSGYRIYFASGTYRLDSIKIITINGNRRAFFLNILDSISSNPLVWVEGIGSLAHPIYLYSYNSIGCGGDNWCHSANPWQGIVPYNYNSFVTCYHHQQTVYIDTCAYETALSYEGPCFYVQDSCIYYGVCGAVQTLSAFSSFDLFPNPSTGFVTINMQVASSSEFEIAIVDMEGRQAIASYPLGKLETGTYSKQIDLSALPSGFYLVECKTSEGSLYRKLVIDK